jgi:hypothetical protein
MIILKRRKNLLYFYRDNKLVYGIGLEECLNKLTKEENK